MSSTRRPDIGQLRKIADSSWGALIAAGESADGNERYDRFLATAVEMITSGASEVLVGDYFVDVEIECLGVDTGAGIRERAQSFARAIRKYLESCESAAA